jgi:hypothetical protein
MQRRKREYSDEKIDENTPEKSIDFFYSSGETIILSTRDLRNQVF